MVMNEPWTNTTDLPCREFHLKSVDRRITRSGFCCPDTTPDRSIVISGERKKAVVFIFGFQFIILLLVLSPLPAITSQAALPDFLAHFCSFDEADFDHPH
jgi:hypothetical protein